MSKLYAVFVHGPELLRLEAKRLTAAARSRYHGIGQSLSSRVPSHSPRNSDGSGVVDLGTEIGRRKLEKARKEFLDEWRWKNLAPDLLRQRLIIEGTTRRIVEPEQIRAYLLELAEVADMEVLSGPVAYSAHEMGYGGWIHWKSSGSHFYSYPTDPPLFTVDMYTCKPFCVREAVDFTKEHFRALEMVWKEIGV